MLKIWNQPVLDQWVLVFSELIKNIPYDIIEKESNQAILNLSEISQHVVSKYISSRMMGYVAEVNLVSLSLNLVILLIFALYVKYSCCNTFNNDSRSENMNFSFPFS